ncbi:hypothetical protein L861_24080 [Litchfieldella anticariensis FP35 = DSM 16096]|uniref:DUF3291 domain-containing protein n=2 Tax=Litchfieldella anticariensis TaxID=258591 RepID=S2LDS2_LITA3|nr:hypothetical protein L861_24080 [Halomonas anticariensis FP35 = DSM 16096]
MTYSVLRAPYGDSLVQEFDDRTPDVFAEAENSPGFITRAKQQDDKEWLTNHQREWGSWGPFAVPRFYNDGVASGHSTQAQTISVWQDLKSVWNFAYHGPLHRQALQMRKDWFLNQRWPIYVIWWIEDNHQTNWREACERLECLHDHGSTPRAFTFRQPFDAQGQPVQMNRL